VELQAETGLPGPGLAAAPHTSTGCSNATGCQDNQDKGRRLFTDLRYVRVANRLNENHAFSPELECRMK
jgi:hypothetical protein